MKRFKKVLLATTLLLSLSITSFVSAEDTQTEVNVKADATVIDVTISPSLAVVIDPNVQKGQAGSLTYSLISIINNSGAPIKIASTGISNNGTGWFNLVSKSKYMDWNNLTTEQSKDIAIGLIFTSGWKNISDGNWTSGNDGDFLQGTIAAKSTAVISVDTTTSEYGTSFDSTKTSVFSIDWMIELE